MFYYKIIKDGIVIDVNNTFFRYQKKHKNIVSCGSRYAQLVQTSDGKDFYTTEWLMPLPEGVEHEHADIVIIPEEEYNELKAKLALDEPIRFEEPREAAFVEEEVAPVIENSAEPMTATEMRKRILELETLVKQLLNK